MPLRSNFKRPDTVRLIAYIIPGLTMRTTGMLPLLALMLASASQSGAQKQRSLDDEFRVLLDARDAAVVRGDSAALHRFISDDLLWVMGATGGTITSAQLLAAASQVRPRSQRFETDSVDAHRDGNVVTADSRRTTRYSIGARDVATVSRASDVFVNRGGRWLLTHHTQVWIPTRPVPVPLDSAALAAFVGRYELAPGYVDNVHWSEGALVATATGEVGGARLVPVSATVFRVGNDVGTVTVFERDSTGRVIGYVSHWPDGHAIRARKLE
ncbi:MAG: nuclear transport factor 2 family protein [Gemmatimonadaceae bacterium]